MKDQERLDLPSASSFGIVAACPGQPNLKKLLPDNITELPDALRDSGIKIHAARENDSNADELTIEELAVYEAGLRYEKKILAEWLESKNIVRVVEGPRESRLWLYDPQTAKPVISGKLDVHYSGVDEEGKIHLLVIDWKTGWAWTLTPSQRNWQLRVQAVLAFKEYNNVASVRVALVKPLSTQGKVDFSDYDSTSIDLSERSIRQILWLSSQPDAPRIAGNHCGYCPCKSICREAAAFSLLPSVAGSQVVLNEDDISTMIMQMSLQDLASVHRRASVIGKILEAIKSRLRDLDDETLSKVGLVKKPGKRTNLINPREVFGFLKTFGVSEEEIWSAAKFTKGEIVQALRRDQGWSEAQAEGFITGQLAEFVEEKATEDSIVNL